MIKGTLNRGVWRIINQNNRLWVAVEDRHSILNSRPDAGKRKKMEPYKKRESRRNPLRFDQERHRASSTLIPNESKAPNIYNSAGDMAEMVRMEMCAVFLRRDLIRTAASSSSRAAIEHLWLGIEAVLACGSADPPHLDAFTWLHHQTVAWAFTGAPKLESNIPLV